ncbi:UDP-glycosyltransferase [Salinimicrobium sp. HB62]|uniref:UDP-glycosyltransferase n=1 Tax=Salinimicrobium sp. HB62 TaxID=3077781 RepID=UPI002D77D398|nr:UDP-glycosyltransferase [Salinimicrobium sp. HB62]
MTKESFKILIVSESLDVDSGSGAKANVSLIKNLLKAGFKLKVYHYTRTEVKIEGADLISIPENRSSLLFFLSRIERYIRKYLKISLNPKIEKKTGFSFTLYNDRNSITASLINEKGFNPDWILTLSQGGSFRPHHALLKLPEWHRKWIAYIHDPYPMHWYPKPYTWRESGFSTKQEFMMEVADKCKYAAFPSLHLKEWMGSHYSPYNEKGIVIPHQLNHNLPSEKPEEVDLPSDEFIVLHAGNMLQARQPQGLINGFKKFLLNNPNARARLIHVGPTVHYQAYLSSEAAENERIEVYCDNMHFKKVACLQENASVNVIIEAKAEISPFLPGKFPHCIAAGKPILLLGPPKSEVRRLMGEDYPFWAEIDNEEKICQLLSNLYENWEAGFLSSDYKEIKEYLSENHLKEVIEGLRS